MLYYISYNIIKVYNTFAPDLLKRSIPTYLFGITTKWINLPLLYFPIHPYTPLYLPILPYTPLYTRY